MNYTAIAILILLSIIIVFVEYNRFKNRKNIDILLGVSGFFLIYFCIIPLIFLFYDVRRDLEHIHINFAIINLQTDNTIRASLLICLGYFSMLIGYLFMNGKINKKTYNKKSVPNSISNASLIKFALISFIVGFFSLAIHTYTFGGITNSIRVAELLRGIDYKAEQSFIFIRIFQPFSLASFYTFFILWDRKRSINSFLFMIFSFMFAVYYLILNAGRTAILALLLVLVIYIIEKRTAIKIKHLILFLIFGSVMAIYGDGIMVFLVSGNNIIFDNTTNAMAKLVSQLINPYVNILKVHDFTYLTGEYRWFSDYIYVWIFNLIPTQILEFLGLSKLPTVWQVNTMNFNSYTAGLPVDIISMGYYQFLFIGVIILNFTFGIVISRLSSIFSNSNDNAYGLLKNIIVLIMSGIVINSDPEVIIRGGLYAWAMLLWFKINKSRGKVEIS